MTPRPMCSRPRRISPPATMCCAGRCWPSTAISRAATCLSPSRANRRAEHFMALLLDLFGYLSVIVHGLTIVAQSMALGGALFLVALARPFERELGRTGAEIRRGTRRIAFWSAVARVLAEGPTLALQG